jgi:hypothetical protein
VHSQACEVLVLIQHLLECLVSARDKLSTLKRLQISLIRQRMSCMIAFEEYEKTRGKYSKALAIWLAYTCLMAYIPSILLL